MFINKLLATIKVSIQNFLVYRVNFALEVLTPVTVFFFIRYSIWLAIYGGPNSELVLHGYTLNDMLTFQCWSLFVELLVYSFNGQNMANEIRLGRISSFLLYPVSFNFYQFMKFLGIMVIQLVIAYLTLFTLHAFGLVASINVMALLTGTLVCLISATIWYWINYISGVMAFWMDETWFLRLTVTLICRLIGGAIVPLEFFPDWLQRLTSFLPFTYMIFYPIKILQNNFTSLFTVIFILCAWCGVLIILANWFWRRGVKSYTSAGA